MKPVDAISRRLSSLPSISHALVNRLGFRSVRGDSFQHHHRSILGLHAMIQSRPFPMEICSYAAGGTLGPVNWVLRRVDG